MVLQPGATSSLDLEKRDRKMAKVIIDIVGLEPEKYRLGYTKVTDGRMDGRRYRLKAEPPHSHLEREGERGFIYCLISVAVVFLFFLASISLPSFRHLAIFTSPLPSYFFFRCFSAPAFSE